MENERPNILFRFLRAIWRGVDLSRRIVVNAIFLLIVIALFAAAGGSKPKVPGKAALVLNPKGAVVEQLTGDPVAQAMRKLDGSADAETLLKDLTDALHAAKSDDRIQAVYLGLDELGAIGPSKLQDLKAALVDFKTSGKKVIAAADSYGNASYFLAAQADEVHLNPLGMVLVEGYGIWRPYFKEGLDKYEVDVHVFRVGEYKSAVEPYLRDDISPEARDSYQDLLGDLWGSWVADVAAARKLTPGEVIASIEGVDGRLRAAHGDAAKMALADKLVDKLSNRDEVRARMIELVGKDAESKSFNQIAFADYLKAKGLRDRKPVKGDAVGVVVAKGTIADGTKPSGEIGGDSTAALIRQAREDDQIKAIVLRVDSPGGSAFASELIRREAELARAAGKPVVVSMGSLAASGGYWISTASDRIFASPDTLTGSIGIFGMIPTFQKPLAKYLGVHVDGVGTTWLSGAVRVDRALDPRAGELIQTMIDRGYEEFLTRVGQARKMTRDEVDKIARGRVWSGADAKRLGLVDELGDLSAAIAAAGKLAKLEGEPKVIWVEKEADWKEQLAADILNSTARLVRLDDVSRPRGLSPARRLTEITREVRALAELDDPQGLFAHCLCEVR
ncbi:MAG: signal peptide peptidase SppA [Holophagales bacterium]|nr:MAG: signal peptide peptidase SppA [Holophagales bacterium]